MRRTHDLIVVGAGSGGLTVAGGAAWLGLKVALVERGRMGGECLNTGCVPSKALLAAAARAQAMRDAGEVGIGAAEPAIDFAAVMTHVRGAIAAIAPHDSQSRFERWGVEVIRGEARFTGRDTLAVGERELRAKRIVLATGSRPAVPPIPGLDRTPYVTNETLFEIDTLPPRLAILGAGPIGMEMAQAFARLGSQVTVVDRGPPLPNDDREAADLVCARLRREGVTFLFDTSVRSVAPQGDGVRLDLEGAAPVEADLLLLATGRVAVTEGLDLDVAGVEVSADGVRVDAARRTSNPRIYAIGDCREGPRFTHAAGYEGSLLVRRLGFGLPAKVDYRALPRATYTDPKLVQVGLTEAQARERRSGVTVVREMFADNDRAVTEGRTEGFVKLVRAGRRLVGATLVGAGAADLAPAWVTAIGGGEGSAWALSGLVLPYPTRSEASKAAAMRLYDPLLFGRAAKLWARIVATLRR